jgi:hypothetical protein
MLPELNDHVEQNLFRHRLRARETRYLGRQDKGTLVEICSSSQAVGYRHNTCP